MDRVAFVHIVHGVGRLRPSPTPLLGTRPSVRLDPLRSARPRRSYTTPTRIACAAGRPKADDNPYSATVNLPKTTFEQRANATKREPQLQAFWSSTKLYHKLSRNNPGAPFTLHDGPPFANGPLHCGHALNKILKDFINKHALMTGRRAIFVPGWDTHGLPIELKVLQSLSSSKRKALTPLSLRKRAREFARQTVDNHMEGMQRWGVWADWDAPYLTLNPEYEAAQMQVFATMFQKGFVFRGRKPVHWSPSTRTALAEAELEYPDGHTSRSVYCAFRAVDVPQTAPQTLRDAFESDSLALSVWTTTPWTLPANRAIAVNKSLTYALVSGLHPESEDTIVVIAKDLVASVANKFGTGEKVKEIGVVTGEQLVGVTYRHPLQDGLICPVVEGGDYITTEAGTGLVHTAPGHGQEDYQTGLREGLELASPVDDAGKFTSEAANGQFAGLPVLGDGNTAVIGEISEAGLLMLEEAYQHKYPYDWRSKKPTIFRATEQWFVSIDGFREQVLEEIDRVEWLPESGMRRIKGMVEGRGDWCISRQRTWGVPIPVFYDDTTGEAVMSERVVQHVCELVREHGTDVWWERETDELLPSKYRGRGLRKGMDTMDVWFDSGTSWAAVASEREGLQYPADVYLEGSDQHRGWFQSSMLTSVATQGKAPYKGVVTHGFVLDEKGVKMSKSIGNVVDPMTVINGGNNKKVEPAYGADVLRLWVCSVDYSGDCMIGPSIMKQVFEVYKKLRNTMRYMVGNLHDFSPSENAVSYGELASLDKYMLYVVHGVCKEIEEGYEKKAFYKMYQTLNRFAVVELSNFYLEIGKDRLYIAGRDSRRRRACQTTVQRIVENVAKMIGPIMPHMAEDVWQNLPYDGGTSSIFEAGWLDYEEEWGRLDEGIVQRWEGVRALRDSVNKVMEEARVSKIVGASMDAEVFVYARDARDRRVLREVEEDKLDVDLDVDSLKRALIVSNVVVAESEEEVVRACEAHVNVGKGGDEQFVVGVRKCGGVKCARCWHYDESVGQINEHDTICQRCVKALPDVQDDVGGGDGDGETRKDAVGEGVGVGAVV